MSQRGSGGAAATGSLSARMARRPAAAQCCSIVCRSVMRGRQRSQIGRMDRGELTGGGRRARHAARRAASAAASRRSPGSGRCCLRARRRRRRGAPGWGRRRRAAARRRRTRSEGVLSRSGAPSGAAARDPRSRGRARAGSGPAAGRITNIHRDAGIFSPVPRRPGKGPRTRRVSMDRRRCDRRVLIRRVPSSQMRVGPKGLRNEVACPAPAPAKSPRPPVPHCST